MIGQTISHYRILEKLGEGGMGVVYKAEDLKLKRTVAIKFLPKNLSVHGEERDRFTLEAQAASALNHPNVATIYEIDEADGETFIVMEYVDGKTLRESMQDLSIRKVTDIGVQIAEGLAAAHEKGIVHRDVKAENIMLRKDGRVQIMDFGLAKLRGVSKLTKTGSTIGTIAYMSPEQVQGIETDSRTDIFSLGVVLYELLTRQLPFKGGHEAAVMYEIVNVEPPPVSAIRQDVEPELERIVMKCLEKDREERYHSVKDVAVDLKHFKRDSEGKRIERRTPQPGVASQQPPTVTGPSAGRARGLPGWLKVAAAALFAVIAVVVWQLMRPPGAVSENLIFKPLQVPFTTVWYPGLSSDGNWIAFPATDANNVTEIYYMHASGGEAKRLTNDSIFKYTADISPDGSQIVFTQGSSRQQQSFPFAAYTVSTLGGSTKRIADFALGSRWSPDGRFIAYLGRDPSGRRLGLWMMDADGSRKRMVFVDSVQGGRVSVAWSPDGKAFAWIRNFLGTTGIYEEIVVHDIETASERQLTNDRKDIDEVYWLPQGEILFSSNRGGASNLWTIPSGGGTPVQITKGPGPDLGIKASRDGKRVLYLQQTFNGSILVGDLAGLNGRQLTPDDQSVSTPSFSPDGRQIAYLVADQDPLKPFRFIYLVDRDGQNRRQLTMTGENIENFVWSPDGRKIAYVQHVDLEVDSAHSIVIVDLSDPSQRKVVGKGRVIGWMRDGVSLNVIRNSTSWKVPIQGGLGEKFFEDSVIVSESPDGAKLAIVDTRPDKFGLLLKIKDKPPRRISEAAPTITAGAFSRWSPDSKNFIFAQDGVLWTVSVETGKLQRYVWKNPEAVGFDDFSPDGKHTVFVKQRMNAKLILIDNFQ